jgi:hypothetical protein
MTVRRFDAGELAKPTKLDNGWLRLDGTLTRVGVFDYRQHDGTTRRELRLPEEVFHEDALTSFELVPVTIDHPPEILDSKNTSRFQKGTVSKIRRDGANLVGTILLTDQAAVDQALKGGRKQLSCGYHCDLDETPGVTNGIPGVADGTRYDAVQRNVRGNHLALVHRARAGEVAQLKLDAADAQEIHEDWPDKESGDDSHGRDQAEVRSTQAQAASRDAAAKSQQAEHDESRQSHREARDAHAAAEDAHAAASRAHREAKGGDKAMMAEHEARMQFHHEKMKEHADIVGDAPRKDSSDQETRMKTIKLDGIDHEVADLTAQAIEVALKKASDLTMKEKARADAAEEKLAAIDVQGLATARLVLVRSAEKLLPAKHGLKLDELADDEIRAAVVKAKFPKVQIEKLKDPIYLAARFDALVDEEAAKPDVNEGLARLRGAGQRQDGAEGGSLSSIDEARNRMIKDNGTAWENKAAK